MKLTIALIFLSSAALSQEPRPLDFDWRKIESIWAAPHLQPALKRISERYNVSQQANIESRIVGGKIAKPGQFPFHVLIILDKNYWCGGSLLNADYVLTVRIKTINCNDNAFHQT